MLCLYLQCVLVIFSIQLMFVTLVRCWNNVWLPEFRFPEAYKLVISKSGRNIIIWVKIKHIGHSVENLSGVKVHTSCKFLKLCCHFWATKIHMDKIFPIWIFFLKRPSYRYYYEKNQIGPTSSSYINLTIKLWIKL